MRERISEVEEEEVIALYSEEKNEIVTGGDANNVANPGKMDYSTASTTAESNRH